MCGFSGQFSNKNKYNRLNTFLDKESLAHRGPDEHQTYSSSNIKIDFYRLKILGGLFGSQPMHSYNNKWLIAFNGEIYNYIEIAKKINMPELIKCGDTRVLLEYISIKGLDAIKDLNGMFAIVLYNIEDKKIYLIRDRFGIKPLFYKKIQDEIHFSSEIKSIPSLEVCDSQIDKYLQTSKYPDDTNTFYKDVYQILPGTINSFYDNTLHSNKYYLFDEEIKKLRQRKRSLEEYEDLIEQSIKFRFRSDVPINIHFSGGVDSTALLIKIKETLGWDYPIEAFTVTFEDHDYLDYDYANKICKSLNVPLHKVSLTSSEVPDLSRQLQYYQDEPYGGIPSLAMYKLNMVEREKGIIVSLEGQGGDEGLGGYLAHIYLAIKDLSESGNNKKLLKNLVKYCQKDFKSINYISEEYIQSGFNAHQDLTNIRKNISNKKIVREFGWLEAAQSDNILNDKIPRTLRFHDRISAACSRELRFPFLDHNVLSYGVALNLEDKYDNAIPKSPLRKIISRYLPEKIFKDFKRSNSSPQTIWLQNDLKLWAHENIDEAASKVDMLNQNKNDIHDMLEDKNLANSFPIWQVINLNLMLN